MVDVHAEQRSFLVVGQLWYFQVQRLGHLNQSVDRLIKLRGFRHGEQLPAR